MAHKIFRLKVYFSQNVWSTMHCVRPEDDKSQGLNGPTFLVPVKSPLPLDQCWQKANASMPYLVSIINPEDIPMLLVKEYKGHEGVKHFQELLSERMGKL